MRFASATFSVSLPLSFRTSLTSASRSPATSAAARGTPSSSPGTRRRMGGANVMCTRPIAGRNVTAPRETPDPPPVKSTANVASVRATASRRTARPAQGIV